MPVDSEYTNGEIKTLIAPIFGGPSDPVDPENIAEFVIVAALKTGQVRVHGTGDDLGPKDSLSHIRLLTVAAGGIADMEYHNAT